jgi:hypothetical protein
MSEDADAVLPLEHGPDAVVAVRRTDGGELVHPSDQTAPQDDPKRR